VTAGVHGHDADAHVAGLVGGELHQPLALEDAEAAVAVESGRAGRLAQ
jgi:hypothetical protein